MQDLLEQGNFLKILSSMGKTAQTLAFQTAISGLTACKGSDLIIAGLGGLFVGLALSKKLGIPFVQAYYYPLTPTREFPNAMVPMPPGGLPAFANRLTHSLAQ
jgi:sterol 3beta-glucosyltransferase